MIYDNLQDAWLELGLAAENMNKTQTQEKISALKILHWFSRYWWHCQPLSDYDEYSLKYPRIIPHF